MKYKPWMKPFIHGFVLVSNPKIVWTNVLLCYYRIYNWWMDRKIKRLKYKLEELKKGRI